MSNVMQGASALMAKYKNVQLAHTVTLGSRNVHHAPLAHSARVDLKPRVLLALTVMMDRRYVQLALLDLSALKDHHSQQSVNQELIVEWVRQNVPHVMPVTSALVVHLSSRDVVMAQPVMPGKKNVQCVPLVIIALEDSNFPVLLALSAAQLVRL